MTAAVMVWLRPRAPQALAAGLGGCIVGSLILVNAAWHISLAARIGVPTGLVWTLPLALDATGILGGLVARIGASRRARIWGAAVGCFAVALSVAAACVEVLIQRDPDLTVTHALAVAVVGVYGVMVGLAAHLLVLLPRAQRPQRKPAAQPAPKPADKPAAKLTGKPASPTRVTAPNRNGERDEWVRHQLDAGVDVTGGDVDRHFGGRGNGYRVVKRVKAERNGHPEPAAR